MKNTTTHLGCLLICFLLSFSNISAQTFEDGDCGTVVTQENLDLINSLTPQLKQYEAEYYEKLANRSSTAITNIPIKAHIMRRTDGSGGLTVQELNDAIDNVNAYYANAFMNFYLCDGINYIDNDFFFDYNTNQEALVTGQNNVPGLINIYFANTVSTGSGGGLCGYAYLPGGPDVILMANDCTVNGSTLPHEIGHFFSLLHTHGPSNSSLTTELVDGSNCDTDGDFICDTPADPQLGFSNVNSACLYVGSTVDSNGDPFAPDPRNIMSYSRKECRDVFSPQQYARMYAGFQVSRNYFECASFNADFTASFNRDCSDTLTVNFTDTSVGATSWQWDVDGDDIIDYTTQNPTHDYTQPGTYDVRLTVSDGTSSLTRVFANLIEFESESINTAQVKLELFTDNWCEETTWEFRDGAGNVLYSGGPYIQNVEDLTLFNYTFDVSLDECYSFEISDTYGDGICCSQGNGYYELSTAEDVVIKTGGAYGFGETTYIANETLSLEEYFRNEIRLFPNPAQNVLNIQLQNRNELPDGIKMFNILGQELLSEKVSSTSDLAVDVSALNAGMYFLKIEKDGQSSTYQFVKE